MRVTAYRIVKRAHAATAFDGRGARVYGGRWNSPGTAVVYAASSVSLAMLEMLVHLSAPRLRLHYVVIPVGFDDAVVTEVEVGALPRDWRRSPALPEIQAIGDAWVASGASAVLRVPSAVVPSEPNYLLNPGHADFAKVTIGRQEPIRFDPRFRG